MSKQLVFVQPEMQGVLAGAGLRNYADFVEGDFGEVVAQSETSQTRRLALDSGTSAATVYLKVYRYGGRRARAWVRRDKASVEATNYCFLRQVDGIDVPEVICYGSRRGVFRRRDAFIVTREVPRAVPLDAFVAARWPDPMKPTGDPLREELMLRTAELVRRMHDAGFYHIDLQWRNLLVSQTQVGCVRVVVIDSSRGGRRRHPVLREHGRLRDLSSLAKDATARMTRLERMRWLKQYLGVSRLSRVHHDLVRTIEMDRVLKDNTPSS